MSKKGKSSRKSHRPAFVKMSRPSVPDPAKKSALQRNVEEGIEESLKYVDEIRVQERLKTTRQIIKIMCLSLNEKYGFGKLRCATTISWMTDLINEEIENMDNDAGDFWYQVDEALKSKGLNFFPTEDEINRQVNQNSQ